MVAVRRKQFDPVELVALNPDKKGFRCQEFEVETSPLLTQARIDRFQTEDTKLTFVLFDEIEKASDSLWQLLLGTLDKATLTLGDNQSVDFSRTIVIMTSNLGAREMSELISGGIGFAPSTRLNRRSITRRSNTFQKTHCVQRLVLSP